MATIWLKVSLHFGGKHDDNTQEVWCPNLAKATCHYWFYSGGSMHSKKVVVKCVFKAITVKMKLGFNKNYSSVI